MSTMNPSYVACQSQQLPLVSCAEIALLLTSSSKSSSATEGAIISDEHPGQLDDAEWKVNKNTGESTLEVGMWLEP